MRGSRNATHDERDREVLASMRRRGEATESDLEHVPGSSEPPPLVADQILGSCVEAITKDVSPAGMTCRIR